MKGHVHNSALSGLIIFGWVLLLGLLWNVTQTNLIASDGEKRQIAGKAMAIFY